MNEEQVPIKDIARLFLRLGTTAFGGPAAHIAMMEHEVVRRRQWLSREKFLDLVGASHLIPGPNSTELAIHIGYDKAGIKGLLTAGVCFIVPAVILVSLCAWAYVRFGSLPEVHAILFGIKPVIIAIVIQAIWSLARIAVRTSFLAFLTVVCAAAAFGGMNELLLLLTAGAVVLVVSRYREVGSGMPMFFVFGATPGASEVVTAGKVSLTSLFLFFLKVGSVLYGSGYVLLAFLQDQLVEKWGVLTQAQLLDAVAVGQFTPGPVFTTATFVGYVVDGPAGAMLATLGIFIPSFIFVAISAPFLSRLSGAASFRAFLDGVNVASLSLMIMVAFQLGQSAIVDVKTAGLALVSATLLLRFKRLNSAWLVLAGGVWGFLGSV